jgi:hypothetical protein
MGAELVRLAAAGRVQITDGRITVLDPAPTGDAEADAALASLAAQRRPPRARTWCSRPRRGICDAYLARLAAAGVLQRQEQTRLGFIRVTRWQVTDPARVTDARARLDAIAQGTGRWTWARPRSVAWRTRSPGGPALPGAGWPGPAQAPRTGRRWWLHRRSGRTGAARPPRGVALGARGEPRRGLGGRPLGDARGRLRSALRARRGVRRPRRRGARRPLTGPGGVTSPGGVSGRGTGCGRPRRCGGPGCPRPPAR